MTIHIRNPSSFTGVLPEVWGVAPISTTRPLWSKHFESNDHIKKQILENAHAVRPAVVSGPEAVCQRGLLQEMLAARHPDSTSDLTWGGVCGTKSRSVQDGQEETYASSALKRSEQSLSSQDIKAIILSN